MSNVIPLEYQGQPVSFNTDGWINATEVAKRFGKRPVDWLRLDETKEYLTILAETLNCEPGSLLETRRGRYNSGTWLHPKLGVRFAQWLNLRFAVWCDLRIDALLRASPSDLQRLQEAEQREQKSQKKGSVHGKGLAQRRWEKNRLQFEIAYWRERTQLALAFEA